MDDKEIQIHEYMLEYQKLNGRPPTLREIAANTGTMLRYVHYHLRELREFGLIEYVALKNYPRRYKAIVSNE